MRRKPIKHLTVLALGTVCLWLSSCGGGGGGGGSGSGCSVTALNVAGLSSCDVSLVCESISTGESGCFSPLVVRGTVFNLADDSPIEGARVVALDANGSPISSVAITDASGTYELTVSTTRDSEGLPIGDDFTLRADADSFQTFPEGIRQAIPIDTANPLEVDDQLVIETTLTRIALIALEAGAGTGAIHGHVDLPEGSRGGLVVAESSPSAGFSAIADMNGDYKIFNLPAGDYSVTAYVQSANYDPGSATVAADDDIEVNLSTNGDATASLDGSVQIVNPGAGDATSVILVVASTFNDTLVRGQTPPGLRAPEPGIAPSIRGSFTITGIPAGRYVILAAFEDDFLVRDPDTCISGTDILTQEFSSGQVVDLSEGFKITGSLDVISPGASGPETVTTTTPTFTWVDDSSEDEYQVTVFDSFGNIVWETTIPGESGADPSVTYNADGTGAGTATPLESGMFYQFRVVSAKADGGGGGGVCELSQTEDLKGVFFVE